MTSEADIMRASDMITRVFKNISPDDVQNSTQLTNSWRTTVESISRNGPKLAAHSHIVDLKNGILLVEADHSGWIQLLQLHQKYILTGLRRLNKNITIESLAFRLAGSNAALADATPVDIEKEKNWLQKKFDDEEEALKKAGFNKNSQNSAKLPQELQNLFDKFKSEMLTNQS